MSRQVPIGELIRSLNEGEQLSPGVSLRGFVKSAEDDEHISFSPGTTCRTWISIPASIIGDVEVLGTRTCKDHEHPLVNITLLTPDDPVAAALYHLLEASTSTSPLTSLDPALLRFAGSAGPTRLISQEADFNECQEGCFSTYNAWGEACNTYENPVDRAVCGGAAALYLTYCLDRCFDRILAS